MIEIDLSFINEFINQVITDFTGVTPWQTVHLFLFKYWGWLLIIFLFFKEYVYPEYMWNLQGRWYSENITTVFLAIDVPKRNEQSIQSMENFFDHLQGAHGTINAWEKYMMGVYQLSFSIELVSIEGNVQFLIRTPSQWRNFVEAAVYSQYPDAEITEVDDYTGTVPRYYPNETHDLWGTEFTLSANKYYPIKSWLKFEHRFAEVFVDPMAALLETMSTIGKGEQCWLQILICPQPVDWGQKEGKKLVWKILEKPEKAAPKGLFEHMIGQTSEMISGVAEQLAGVTLVTPEAEEVKLKFPNLTPGQKELAEGVERKISKLAFNSKIRYIYVAEKDKMNKGVGANAIVGAIKQWTDMNANGLKPDMKTTATSAPKYFFIERRRNTRKNIILRAYINRSDVIGSAAKPLCSEELASLWHFPSMYVKAPLLKTTPFKKASAPVGLPLGELPQEFVEPKTVEEKKQEMPTFDYDNDSFEQQFAKDKQAFIKSRPGREKQLQEIAKEDEKKLAEAAKKAEVATVKKNNKITAAAKSTAENEPPTAILPKNLPFID